MKKIIAIFTVISLFLSSCSKFVDDYDISPNSPSEVTAALLLTDAQVGLFSTAHGQLARFSGIMTQQLAGTDFQMIDVENYVILEGDNSNEWNIIYADILNSCDLLIEGDYGKGNPYYRGCAKVLKAISLGIATDAWGDVPNKEAGKGLDNLNPKYDAQQSVISSMQELLSSAIEDFKADATANNLLPSTDDLVFGGDVEAWTKAAWTLKARYANRLSKRDASQSATDALSYLTNAALTKSDNMNAVFGSAGNNNNTWFAFENARGGYIRCGKNLIDLMSSNNDPRADFYAAGDTGGVIRGAACGSYDQTASPIGSHLQQNSLVMIGYVEGKFIEAEANFRLNKKAEAATAFNDAVKASVLEVTGAADAAFEASVAAETSASITLEKIMSQKYVAMFGSLEVWSDWRRTGLPTLTPNANGQVAGIPRRLPTTLDERVTNKNANVESDILKPVWWDQ